LIQTATPAITPRAATMERIRHRRSSSFIMSRIEIQPGSSARLIVRVSAVEDPSYPESRGFSHPRRLEFR